MIHVDPIIIVEHRNSTYQTKRSCMIIPYGMIISLRWTVIQKPVVQGSLPYWYTGSVSIKGNQRSQMT